MNIALLSGKADNVLTMIVAIIIAVVAIVGAGVRIYFLIKNHKITKQSLANLLTNICKDEAVYKLLKQIFNDKKCFEESNTSEEFIDNVSKEVGLRLYNYIKANTKYIPDSLLTCVTVENMTAMSKDVLKAFGYTMEELTKLFTNYLVDTIAGKDAEITTDEDTVEDIKDDVTDAIDDLADKLKDNNEVKEVNVEVVEKKPVKEVEYAIADEEPKEEIKETNEKE